MRLLLFGMVLALLLPILVTDCQARLRRTVKKIRERAAL